ncbi:hypothetical protein RJ639_031067 [Escallonia herrerae]|uniref:MIT domain-containing protein n=1 Tax=Escallonia herrerae TaxID=1293975 RepID=A0AA88X7Y6_9ASTE|nr:hypothetical protein RJ639_031067 [Escallonia herrerae]
MYSNFKEQAEYVKQAEQVDNADNYTKAFPLYMNALEYLKTHSKCKKLRTLRSYSEIDLVSMLNRGDYDVMDDDSSRLAAKLNAAVASWSKTKPKNGGVGQWYGEVMSAEIDYKIGVMGVVVIWDWGSCAVAIMMVW